jgi:hypothetical protein
MTDEPRIAPLAIDEVEDDLRRGFEGQIRKWGEPLRPHLIYARRPTILRAARGMWAGLSNSGLLGGALHAIVFRRVAIINGCVF